MKKVVVILTSFVLISLCAFLVLNAISKKEEYTPPIEKPNDEPIIDVEEKTEEEKLDECMGQRNLVFEEQLTLDIQALLKEFKKYNVSVMYDNLLDDYQVMYNEKINYYSASTVKPAAALYYYKLAAQGLIDLDEKALFSERYYNETIRKRIGLNSMVSLRTVLNYSMTYSDNGAHKLLVERAGYKTLNDFVKETMATENTFFPNTTYGHINAVDGTILIKEVYKFIEENDALGQELKGYMTNSSMSTLKLDGIKVAQKYGWWEKNFHVLGIIYDKQPYTLVILTQHGENDEFFAVNKKINQKVYEFHTNYMEKKANFCSNKVAFG